MTIGEVEIVKTSEFYPKGRKLKCSDCLYGSSQTCPGSIAKRCGEYLGWLPKWKYELTVSIRKVKTLWDKTSLFEIIDNKDYYELDQNEKGVEERWYVYCHECGYIPYKRSAYEKCISKAHFVQCDFCFSQVEIQKMKEDKKYSDMMRYDLDYE